MRKMDIEKALQWAYEELAKDCNGVVRTGPFGPKGGWGSVSSYAQLLTVIDENRYGLVPNLAEAGEPHPDAVRIADAVVALDECALGFPDYWAPFADIAEAVGDLAPDLISRVIDRITRPDGAGGRISTLLPARLVRRVAILKEPPQWACEQPERKFVRNEDGSGKPKWFRKMVQRVEIGTTIIDGEEYPRFKEIESEVVVVDPRKVKGAYRKEVLDPDPIDVIVARAEYEVWYAALGVLVDDLLRQASDGGLETIRVTPSRRSPCPWETPDTLPVVHEEPRQSRIYVGRKTLGRKAWDIFIDSA